MSRRDPRASDRGTETGRQENGEGKDIPGKGNSMCKGLSKRKRGESKRLKEGHVAVERIQGHAWCRQGWRAGQGRADRTQEAVAQRASPSSYEPGEPRWSSAEGDVITFAFWERRPVAIPGGSGVERMPVDQSSAMTGSRGEVDGVGGWMGGEQENILGVQRS